MVMTNTDFQKYLNDQLQEQKDLYVPVDCNWYDKFLVQKVKCTNIHPNPDDEFCFPNVGPSYRIIGEYEKKFRDDMHKGGAPLMEPLIVLKAHPRGYILQNGHHRWAAALKLGVKKVPVQVVNMMLPDDIKRVIEESNNVRRVTLDLDEVVFRDKDDENIEKIPSLFMSKNKKRIRLGIPALFRYLRAHDYDIWVYSRDYYSTDDVAKLFKKYSVSVDGIITGTGNKFANQESEKLQNIKNMVADKYKTTIHIDNDMLLVTRGKGGEFEEHELDADDEKWSKDIIEFISKLDDKEVDSKS